MKTKQEISTLSSAFLKVRSNSKLLELLHIDEHIFNAACLNPVYNVFYVNKPSGGQRLIEDPADELQALQARLSTYLQAVYHIIRIKGSYAFQWIVENDIRNIRTNAIRHMNNPFMLKIDLKDYFHQITAKRLTSLFQVEPFCLTDQQLLASLVMLCTFKGRLPMGSPVSPVLAIWPYINLILSSRTYQRYQTLHIHDMPMI